MSTDDDQFRSLLDDLRGGSEEAAWKIVELYSDKIRRVIRRRMRPSMRRHLDSADFLQAVWATFLVQPAKIGSFTSSNHLIAFLAKVAQRKVINEDVRLHARKNDVSRDRPIDNANESTVKALPGDDPTPSQVAVARETWLRLFSQLTKPHQEIVRLRFQGFTQQEISDKTGVSVRTVRRVLDKLKKVAEDDD